MPRESKDIECSNKCGVVTTVNVPKANYNRGKRFLCGFCTATGLKENEDQIKKVKAELNSEVTKLNDLLALVKGSLDTLNSKLNDEPKAVNQSGVQVSNDRKLNIIIMGVSEQGNKDAQTRGEEESTKLAQILQEIGINEKPEEVISDYRRLGQFQEERSRKRPLLITCNHIWNKRRLVNAYVAHKREVDFRFKDDTPMTETRKKAIVEARKKNDAEKENAETENREIKRSFSAKDDGSVVEYQNRNGRWIRKEIVDDEV